MSYECELCWPSSSVEHLDCIHFAVVARGETEGEKTQGTRVKRRFSCSPAALACFEVHHVRPGTAATAEAMTVPQRRLAGLWPWLFMAALQVVLGQPGLEPERPALRAVIRVTLLRSEPAGQPITLEGLFVGGSAGYAEGKLMQVREQPHCHTPHPHSPFTPEQQAKHRKKEKETGVCSQSFGQQAPIL